MLFVPDEDYVRIPDQNVTTSSDTIVVSVAAAAVEEVEVDADDDDDDNVADEEKDAGESAVSTSILFASQAQYLGNSYQVSYQNAPSITTDSAPANSPISITFPRSLNAYFLIGFNSLLCSHPTSIVISQPTVPNTQPKLRCCVPLTKFFTLQIMVTPLC